MPRIQFNTGEQRKFLEKARACVNGRIEALANICAVHPRTLRDWCREKYLMSAISVEAIQQQLKIKPPKSTKVLSDHWHIHEAGKIGAIKRYEMYGSPGTKEGRSKGGKISCFVQQTAAKKGVVTGFIVRKDVNLPSYSENLAEAVGIILGDGSISKFQISISSSAKVDNEYADYISRLFKGLFKVDVARLKIRKNTIVQTISSREVVEYFNKMGLKIGDKLKNNITIPRWIVSNESYLKACLKGLFDTDGCIYYHCHYTRGREYNDIGWEFRNLNVNLLKEFQNFLLKKGFNSKIKKASIAIYNRHDISKYFKEIGSNNPKHIKRYLQYFNKLGGMREMA